MKLYYVLFGRETHSFALIVHLCIQHNSGGITNKSTITNYKLLIIIFFKCFLACPNMKAPATYAHCFDIQCFQYVIRTFVYGFMCRLDSSLNYIIKDILATRLRYTSRIRKHLCSLLYINS